MNNAIDVRDLRKTFGTTSALDGLDLTVAEGEIHGFLGPNGAGKSTTLRILLGLIRKDSGEITLLGGDPWTDAVALHRQLAYVPGDVTLWPNLTGGEVIDLLGRLRGSADERVIKDLIERFDLDPTKKSRSYSKGNRQKVALIAALGSGAPLLLLDEPTSGLDPLMEATFRDVVADLRRTGTTVLLSSHILSEVEHLADRVTIIRDGVAVESGSLAGMRQLARTRLQATTLRPATHLSALSGVSDVVIDDRSPGSHITAQVDADALERVMAYLAGVGVQSLTAAPPTLEELFLSQYTPSGKSP